jgi:hypothetical protein
MPERKSDYLAKALNALGSKELVIGIPAEKNERSGDSPIGNAAIGYIHEFGSAAQNIPARPHLREGILDQKEVIKGHLEGLARNVLVSGIALRGNVGSMVNRYFHEIGRIARDSVKNKIQEGLEPQIQPESLLGRVTARSLRREYQRELREEAFPSVRSRQERMRLARQRRHGLTLIEKARSEVGGAKPLWDTGSYRNAITYAIRDKQ